MKLFFNFSKIFFPKKCKKTLINFQLRVFFVFLKKKKIYKFLSHLYNFIKNVCNILDFNILNTNKFISKT